MVLFVYSCSLILLGIAIYASVLVINALRPNFYIGFLRHPNRQSCCSAFFHVFFVSMIMEMLLLSKTLFYENENITKLILKTDYLQDMADTYPKNLILSLDDFTQEILIDHNKMPTPFIMDMPTFYRNGINVFLTYLATRYSVNPTLVQNMLPIPRILFVNDKAMQLDYLDKHPNILKNKHDDITLFDNWWTIVLNVDKNNKRMKHKKQKILLFDRMVEMEYTSHFNHLDTFVKMFCKKTVSSSSSTKKFKYRCTKEIVKNKLFMIKKLVKQKLKNENIFNIYKSTMQLAMPILLIASISIGLFFVLTFLESLCAIVVMSIPAYAICCFASYRNYRGYGFPSYLSVLRLCCYTFTLYGLIWAIFGDLFSISKLDVDHFSLYKDLIFVYVIWTFSCCRQAIVPVVVIHRQQGNVNYIVRRNNNVNVAVVNNDNVVNTDNDNTSEDNQPTGNDDRRRREEEEMVNVNNDEENNRTVSRQENDLMPSIQLPLLPPPPPQHPHQQQQQQHMMMMHNPQYQRQIYQYFYYNSLYRLQMERRYYHHQMQQQQQQQQPFNTPEKDYFINKNDAFKRSPG